MIDKVGWVLIAERRLLSVRSHGKTRFYLPGGKREPGESDADCLVREIREELGVTLLPETLRFVERFSAQADGDPAGAQVTLACYTAEYAGSLAPAAEIAELAWLTLADRERGSLAQGQLLEWLHARGLID